MMTWKDFIGFTIPPALLVIIAFVDMVFLDGLIADWIISLFTWR